jgi:hypothetical protein
VSVLTVGLLIVFALRRRRNPSAHGA